MILRVTIDWDTVNQMILGVTVDSDTETCNIRNNDRFGHSTMLDIRNISILGYCIGITLYSNTAQYVMIGVRVDCETVHSVLVIPSTIFQIYRGGI